MKKSLLFLPIVTLVLLLSVFTVTAPAQEIFHIGDLVEVQDGSSWIQGRIESVQGSIAKVRTGNAKYDFINVQLPTTRFRRPGSAAREAKENQLQEAFAAEALDKYFRSVQMFAPFYDEEYISAGAPTTAAGWNEVVAHLAEVDVLCKGKYAGVTNAKWLVRKDLKYRYADWCQIAARRKELEPKFRAAAAKHMIGLTNTEDNLKFAFEHQKNRVPDETQMLMYDRARWKQQQTPKYQPRFAEYGIEMPADFFAEVEKKADELKQLIEQTAPKRSWEPPSFTTRLSKVLSGRGSPRIRIIAE